MSLWSRSIWSSLSIRSFCNCRLLSCSSVICDWMSESSSWKRLCICATLCRSFSRSPLHLRSSWSFLSSSLDWAFPPAFPPLPVIIITRCWTTCSSLRMACSNVDINSKSEHEHTRHQISAYFTERTSQWHTINPSLGRHRHSIKASSGYLGLPLESRNVHDIWHAPYYMLTMSHWWYHNRRTTYKVPNIKKRSPLSMQVSIHSKGEQDSSSCIQSSKGKVPWSNKRACLKLSHDMIVTLPTIATNSSQTNCLQPYQVPRHYTHSK